MWPAPNSQKVARKHRDHFTAAIQLLHDTGPHRARQRKAMIMDKLLLSPSEAAEALSIGRSKLYELLTAGQLESVRIGSCRRIPLAAVMDYVQRLEAGEAERGKDTAA